MNGNSTHCLHTDSFYCICDITPYQPPGVTHITSLDNYNVSVQYIYLHSTPFNADLVGEEGSQLQWNGVVRKTESTGL